MKKKLIILGVVIPVVFGLDRLTKQLILDFIPLGSSLPVFPGFFDIVHTRNRGAAFGFLAGLPDSVRLPFFTVVSAAALLAILLYFFFSCEERKDHLVGLALILGGAAGNIWDRIFFGEVIDFLSFHWHEKFVRWKLAGWSLNFKLEWPAFNIADAAITIAVLWLMFRSLFPLNPKGPDR